MNNFFDNQRILQLIWRRKIHFIIIGVVAIIISAVFSSPFFIKPKFRSTARIYPSNLWVLSEESETEQMLEILNSRDIKLKMFDAFDLDQVYKIDRNDQFYLTYMFDIYNKNVKTNKTNFETVEIQVMDHDPQRASDMCDSLIFFYNKKVRDMHKKKDFEMVTISEKGLKQKYAELNSLILRLDTLKQNYGILDYKSQVEKVTEGYMTVLAEGITPPANRAKIENLYNNLAEQGTQAYLLEKQFDYITDVIDSLTTQHEFYLAEYEKDITYCHVVENPVPADKKSYPVRWLIVSLSTLSALFIALIVLLVLDYRQKTDF
jgi:capsular polysaccharide biosynthesis protein